MTDSLKPYPHYKPSGVEWLGDVPAHWDVRRLKGICRLTYGDSLSSEDRIDGSVPVYGSNGQVGFHSFPNTNGQCLIIGRKGSFGKVQYSSEPVFAIDTTFFVDNRYTDANIRWLYYLLGWLKLDAVSKDSAVPGLNREDAYQHIGFYPPLAEQTAIVRYLDQTDERIRRYISSRERLIELLEEYRQAVIHDAVTRGLDPDVRLKPSGVEWLGDVPAHWGVAAVKRHYSIQLGKMLQNGPNVPTDIAVPYLKAQHVQWFSVRTTDAPTMWASPHEIEQFGVRAGDLLVCEGGEGGRCSLVEEVPPGYIIQNALHRVRSSGNSRNDYLQYVMSSISKTGWFDAINNKATIAHFTVEKFGSLMIPVPPIPEQAAIVAYLDKATADIDAAIDRARREIELLSEYRTRLIADLVTGQVDVRDAATRLPDEAETLIDTEQENRESTRYVID